MAYNTVPFHGKVCRIHKNNVAMSYTKGWNVNVSLDMADQTSQGDNWKSALPGAAGWSGNFAIYFVAGNTEQKAIFDNIVTATPGTKLTDINFILDATANALTGDIYITGLNVGAEMGGVVAADVSFQGDGALTLTSSAT